MRKIFSIFFLMFLTIGLLMNTAEAKRFGGGKSFGMQRSMSNYSRPHSPISPLASQVTKQPNRWLGPLAGLAAGGLLGYLMMGHGVGSGIFSWLAIAAIGMFLWSLIRNKLQPATQPRVNGFSDNNVSQFNSSNSYQSFNSNRSSAYPEGFEADVFLREAKAKFIRLQAAYDNKNLNDLREFTTPEVLAEIQLQFQERGDASNFTEVVSLNAELMDVATENQTNVASVQFSGTIREEQNTPASLFSEIWHFRKDLNQSSWFVAGIQQ